MPHGDSSRHAAVLAGGTGGEGVRHRLRLTLLFSDLSGSSHLSSVVDPEDFLDVIDALREIWHRVASGSGGRILRRQGGGGPRVFGYPSPAEDDGVRAVEAALRIQEEVSRLSLAAIPVEHLPLAVHAGVHAGLVVVTEGDMARGHLDLAGQAVNDAAHLAAAAGRGQVLVATAALGPYTHCFELAPVTADQRAKTAERAFVHVLRRSSLIRRFDAMAARGRSPLVARDGPLRALVDFMQWARPGDEPGSMLISAGAGLGKTRLVEEAVARLPFDTLRLLRGTCEHSLHRPFLQAFAEMLQNADPAAWGDDGTPWARLLARVAALSAPADGPAGAGLGDIGILNDLCTALRDLSKLQPLVLVIDDWHWADDASLHLVAALMAAPSGPRLVLATRTPTAGSRAAARETRLELQSLTLEEGYPLAVRWVPHLDPFLYERMHDASGGNPLLLEELCQQGSLHALSRALDGSASPVVWLANLVAARLGTLSASSLEIVQWCAVVGSETPARLLCILMGREPTVDQLLALRDADLLSTRANGQVLRFKHALTRQAVYQHIGPRQREKAHERVLDVLSRPGSAGLHPTPQLLAHHSEAAGLWALAARHGEEAGDAAIRAHVLDRARASYALAMQALEGQTARSPEHARHWAALAAKRAMASVFDPLSINCDVSIFERALALSRGAGTPADVMRSLYGLAYLCYATGRTQRALALSTEMTKLAADRESSWTRAQLDALRGAILCTLGRHGEAIGLIDHASGVMRARARDRESLAIGMAYALACKGGIEADRGRFGPAHACFDESLALLEGTLHPLGNSVRNWLAVALNWQGEWAEARRVALDSMRIAEHTRALLLLSAAQNSLGYATWAEAAADPRAPLLEQAMRWADERGGLLNAAIYHGWLTAIAAARGDEPAVRHHAGIALTRARVGERMGEAVACRSLAWLHALKGRPDASQRWLARAQVAAHRRGSAREEVLNTLLEAQLAMREGRMDAADAAFSDAARGFQQLGMRWHRSQADQLARHRCVERVVLN